MIIVLAIIFIILLVTGLILNRCAEDSGYEGYYGLTIFLTMFSIAGILGCGLAATALGVGIQKANTFDSQIESLTERAELLADQIDAAIDECIEHENESELFSGVVSKLMDSYTQTMDTISELQIKQSKLPIWRWWLYFGS